METSQVFYPYFEWHFLGLKELTVNPTENTLVFFLNGHYPFFNGFFTVCLHATTDAVLLKSKHEGQSLTHP